MSLPCALWLALTCYTSAGREDAPAPGSPAPLLSQNAPLLLSPLAASGPDHGDTAAIPTPTLAEELERLKQEHESFRLLLQDASTESPGFTNTGNDSARRLRTQIDQLSNEIGLRQNGAKSEAPKKPGTSRPAAPSAVQGKPPSIVSNLTREQAKSPGTGRKPPDGTGKPVDPISLGQVLLRTEDYEGAARAFRAVELVKLRADDRAYVQYLLAAALRSSGQAQEALPLYREVANSKADPLIADCARWQLSLMQWRHDLETQLETLQQRRRSLGSDPAPQPINPAAIGQTDATEENP